MGGAIARGIAASQPEVSLSVSSPNRHGELDRLAAYSSSIAVTTSNTECIAEADFIVVAVKPWLLATVIDEIAPVADFSRQTLVSIVDGVSCSDILAMLPGGIAPAGVVRVIPNTAIAVMESVNFVTFKDTPQERQDALLKVLEPLGMSMPVEERLMGAGTALASCGIAYAFRYIRAAAEGGVELGFYPDQAKKIVMQTLLGAVKLLEASGENPETEIDKVTTPGGITIKGLNAMERNGFTTAVIEGLKNSCK